MTALSYEAPQTERSKELILSRQEIALVRSWIDQQLPVYLPLDFRDGKGTWVKARIKRLYFPKSGDDRAVASVQVVHDQVERTSGTSLVETLSVRELIEQQNRYFLEQAFEARRRATERLDLSLQEETAALEHVSHRLSTDTRKRPPDREELRETIERFVQEYRQAFLTANRRSYGTPTGIDTLPEHLATFYWWGQGDAVPAEEDEHFSSFSHWQREDFKEAYDKAVLALEAFPLGILLEELLQYGVTPQGIPACTDVATYKAFLLFLEQKIIEARQAGAGRITLIEDPEKQALFERQLAQIELWRAAHRPLHVRIGGIWSEATLSESTELRADPRDPTEKGVEIVYVLAKKDDQATPAPPQKRFIRLSQLMEFQDQYFLEQARLEQQRLQIHPALDAENTHNDLLFSRESTAISEDMPPSREEKSVRIRSLLQAYRQRAYAHAGLVTSDEAREEPPFDPEEALRHMNAWAHGRGAEQGSYAYYRELHEPFWRDQDYAEVVRVLQLEIRKIDLQILAQKIIRFGVASTNLPTAVTPERLLQFLEQLQDGSM